MILLNDLKYIIEMQLQKYPKMQPQDAVKLVYQHVYGNGHMVKDAASSLDFIRKEYESIRYAHQGEDLSHISLVENIGNWYARMNLLAVKDEEELISLNDAFVASAGLGGGNQEYFLSRLYFLQELADNGMFEFDGEDMQEYLRQYEKDGYPLVSHSVRYKEFYDPAYRVIDARYIRLLPLITKIRKMLKEKERVVLAIDGRAASGKTTAAELLALIFDASVIHMDDFFLPMEKRTRERFAEPGGNIDYERFRDEVARFIKKKEDFSYRRFDCSIMNFREKIDIQQKPLMIIEGAYSQHIEYRSIYDLKVFFNIDPMTQRNQIYQRGGENALQMYSETWIPLEEKYFEHSEIKDKSDMVIEF
ncbi:MAG: uridine kinase [Lachnospiraceae bacterium]